MPESITHLGGSINPQLIDGYSGTREARTIVHTILGKASPDVTLRGAGLRTGELILVFATEGAARSAEQVLAVPQVLTLEAPDTPTLAMSFVVAEGSIRTELDPATRKVWTVTVPFVEVS